MTNELFEYDVALSFAGEDRAVAEEFANLLRTKAIKVLLDEYQSVDGDGNEFDTRLAELYRTRARYCVMLVSRHYPLKKWTESKRASMQQRALRDADEYILAIQLDDVEVPGIRKTKGYRNLRRHSMESIVGLLVQKLTETRDRSGPPSQSHDLRSGNIPPAEDKL